MRQILPQTISHDAQESRSSGARQSASQAAEIKNILDEYVIGQDAAKKQLSSAFTITTSVFFFETHTSDVELEKSTCF